MKELPIEISKLNIVQKIKLNLFKSARKIDIDKYKMAPDYIKNDLEVVDKIIEGYKKSEYPEDVLSEIPTDKLINCINKNIIYIGNLSDKMKYYIAQIDEKIYGLMEDVGVALYAMKNGDYEFVKKQISYNDIFFESKLLSKLEENAVQNNDEMMKGIFPSFSLAEQLTILKVNPDFINALDKENQIKVFAYLPQCGKYANEETQIQYLDYYKHYDKERFIKELKYFGVNIQEKYIAEDISLLKYASEDVLEKYKGDINYFHLMPIEYQIEKINEEPQLFKLSSEKVKFMYFYEKGVEKSEVLKQDISNSKYYVYSTYRCEGILDEIFDGIEKEDIETIRKMFLHSKLMDAHGHLVADTLHNMGESVISTRDSFSYDVYSLAQTEILKKLNLNQLEELISVDENYVLGYCYVPGEKSESTLDNCKKLFLHMFGDEKFQSLEGCIDGIYKLQDEYFKKLELSSNALIDYKGKSKMPLQELKILFNRKIINNNTIDDINAYYNKVVNGESAEIEFENLIRNAYGDKAVDILKSRPELDVHEINSLEIFDESIIENFTEGFVHDLISYNIEHFSCFLDVVKQPKKLEIFKIYYETLTKVMGENVETMQKALKEFDYIENILTEVKDIDLSEEEYLSLASVLCSYLNLSDINTIEELKDYDNIANNHLKKRIDGLDKNSPEVFCAYCEELLGFNYKELKWMGRLYDFSELELCEYDEAEKCLMNTVNLILYYSEGRLKLLESFMDEKGIRNPIALHSAIKKTREREMELLNNNFLTKEKMDELIYSQEIREGREPTIYKEEIDGLEVYHLNGVPYRFIAHSPGAAGDYHRNEVNRLKDFMTYDGQFGNTALCCRYARPEIFGDWKEHYIFTHIDEDMLIVVSDADARTTWAPKKVKNYGDYTKKARNIDEINNKDSEVTMYRRFRNHKKISNENYGGRRLPDFFGGVPFDEEIREILRKNKIPCLVVHYEKYREIEQLNKNEEMEMV